jgi:hypothetical protein
MAVVSQPNDRGAKVPMPAQLDSSLGEFWVSNPFDIIRGHHNLSSYERKRCYLNVRGQNFLDISFLTGADNDGDGRSVVAADFRNNGRMDLLTRSAGGGAVLLYENNFPQRNYLKVSLRGRPEPGTKPTSNRQGIGARLVAHVGDRQIVRELYPANSFRSQAPLFVHFGLGDATQVDRLTIRWPSGKVQELTGLAANAHIVVDEGKEGSTAVETVVPGQTMAP